MNAQFRAKLEQRLLRYVQIDTESDESSLTTPSTAKQYDLLNLLVDELADIGAADILLTYDGAVLSTVPSTVDADVPVVAFAAHPCPPRSKSWFIRTFVPCRHLHGHRTF